MDSQMTTPFDNADPWQDRLSEYLDGLLTEPETLALEEHLVNCEHCRTSLAELRAVVARLRADRPEDVPEDGWPRIASRLPTRTPWDARVDGGRERTPSLRLQRVTLRKISAAAALTLMFVGGVWAGVSLCLAESAWTPPGWMHLRTRASNPASRPVQRTSPSYSTDSIPDEWTPLRRSLSALDEQLAGATRALAKEPGNKVLQRQLLLLTRERNDLRALLDSSTAFDPRSGLPQR